MVVNIGAVIVMLHMNGLQNFMTKYMQKLMLLIYYINKYDLGKEILLIL